MPSPLEIVESIQPLEFKWSSTTARGVRYYVPGQRIISAVPVGDDTFEVVWFYPSNTCNGNGNESPGTVEKTIYKCVDNKFVIAEVVKGVHHPAYNVSEQFEF